MFGTQAQHAAIEARLREKARGLPAPIAGRARAAANGFRALAGAAAKPPKIASVKAGFPRQKQLFAPVANAGVTFPKR